MMKNSAPYNTKPTTEPIHNSGSNSHRMSYGTGSNVEVEIEIDTFDPALELKRLRQELIERLLLIQRKAALNAQSENQKNLSVTIVPKLPQSTAVTNPQKSLNSTIHSNHSNANFAADSFAADSFDSPENSAKRIMDNIESARICISQLQVPNISQPHLKLTSDKSSGQQNYSRNKQSDNLLLQTQNQINSLNLQNSEYHLTPQQQNLQCNSNDKLNCNVNSDNIISQDSAVQFMQNQNQNQNQKQVLKPDSDNNIFWLILLQKLNFGLSLIGIVGIFLGIFYLFNGGVGNFQPGVPVLFVGLVLIVSGLLGHLLQEYVNGNCQITNSATTRNN